MESWIFTFGIGQEHANKYVLIKAESYADAREKMFSKYGKNWAFQYSEEEWKDWESRRPLYMPIETLLEIIE